MMLRGPIARIAGLCLVAIAGCKSLFAPRGIPEDPLILSRQPIESKGQVTRSTLRGHHEPAPPQGPGR